MCSPISCSLKNFLWIAFTVPMLKLLNLHTAVFRQYQKEYCILHIAFISVVASSNKCSEFDFISLFIFLSKQNFLECTFQIMIWKLSIGSFIEIIEMYILFTFNNCARAQLAQLALRNHLNLYEVIRNFMFIMNSTIRLNESLFISLSQFLAIFISQFL